MAELNCPLCGSQVRVPHAKTHERFLCKKCHTPFHLNKSGSAVVGEPPDLEEELKEIKQKLQLLRERFPVRRIVAGLAVLLVVGLSLSYLLQPAERLDRAAERAARAFAENDLAYLKSTAALGTSDDVVRWFDEVHPRLVQERERWHGQKEVVEVHVAQEDRAQRKGSVGVSIHPGVGTARDVTLANPVEATASAAAPVDLNMAWTLDRWGRWKLDGRATFAKSHPTP
jgi:hypothetical protein